MRPTFIYAIIGGALFTAALSAQAPAKPAAPAAAPAAANTGKEIILNATSANVKGSGMPVKIRIFRWSSDEEKTPLVAALTAPPPGRAAGAGGAGGARGARGGGAPGAAGAAEAPGAAGARGAGAPGAAGARGAAAAGAGAPAGDAAAAGAGRAQAAGGGGRGGRGGRGDAAPLTPIQRFTEALQKAPTVGYIWTTDVTGYSIKYAVRTAQPDGSERIVLATDRRLGAYSPDWELKQPGTPTDYEFTLLELHMDAKGGEGKSSLTTKIAANNDTKQLALEDYQGAPAILQNVKH